MNFDHNGIRQYNEDGSHACETIGCENIVPTDDKPYCPDHTRPGMHYDDYSYRNAKPNEI